MPAQHKQIMNEPVYRKNQSLVEIAINPSMKQKPKYRATARHATLSTTDKCVRHLRVIANDRMCEKPESHGKGRAAVTYC